MQLLKQCAADMKPVADRLSKTGSALMKLVADDEAERIREVVDDLTSRFDSVKNVMRQRANKLDDALQHMSEVCARVLAFCVRAVRIEYLLNKVVYLKVEITFFIAIY